MNFELLDLGDELGIYGPTRRFASVRLRGHLRKWPTLLSRHETLADAERALALLVLERTS